MDVREKCPGNVLHSLGSRPITGGSKCKLGRVFPVNHLAVVLSNQTYNNQDKHKKPEPLNLTRRY